jgi:glycerol-3-phosphate acyltransferase PlsY
MITALVMIIAYMLGSLQFGILLSKAFGLADPRDAGSGNTGATNVARNSGMKFGLLVLLGDLLKGVVAVLLGYAFGLSELGAACAGLAAVIGHMYPAYYQFKGGKGVATALGVVLTLSPLAALIAVIVMVVVVALTRYVSLGSMLAAIIATIFMGITHSGHYMIPVLVITILIIWRHSENIKRLVNGRENKFDFRKKR